MLSSSYQLLYDLRQMDGNALPTSVIQIMGPFLVNDVNGLFNAKPGGYDDSCFNLLIVKIE